MVERQLESGLPVLLLWAGCIQGTTKLLADKLWKHSHGPFAEQLQTSFWGEKWI